MPKANHRHEFEPVRTLKLDKPLHYAGESIKKLPFREPSAALFRVIEKSDKSKFGRTLEVLSYFTGIGPAALESLKFSDAAAAAEIVGELIEGENIDLDGLEDSALKG